MLEMYKKVVFENYANFKGRARRSEYWYFTLANVCISLSLIMGGSGIGAIFGFLGEGAMTGFFLFLFYYLISIIPTLAVSVRRLHDTEKSGLVMLIGLIPSIGGIILLVFFCSEGTRGANKYGKNPKEEFDELYEIGKE